MRERHILRAWPLTPIHIGTGEELTPESFVLDEDGLRPINGFAALSAASDAQRHQYQKLLKGGDFVDAQKHLADLAKKAENAGETISVSDSTRADLEKVLTGQSIGKGGIRPFIRDGGDLILLGSSLKGALRTAWVDQAIVGKRAPVPADPSRDTSQDARKVNRLALDIVVDSALEQDPFRDIAVADAPIPQGRTRYDKATVGKLDRERQKLNDVSIQMHVERLISLADGGAVSPFEIGIGIATETFVNLRAKIGMREGGKRSVPKAAISAKALWEAANRFHADLWRYERNRFYADSQAGSLLDSLLKAFGLPPGGDLAAGLNQKGLILIRVGRYSHFESKAVRLNGKRYGIKVSTRAKSATFMEEGGSRTTAKTVNGIATPFGWLLLALPGMGPQGPVTAVPLKQAGQLRFRKGDKVVNDSDEGATLLEDVSFVAAKMDVRFDGGDIEEVSVPAGNAGDIGSEDASQHGLCGRTG